MGRDILAFGELLWDLLPSGRHAGGAPFNVCVHLAALGLESGLISAVGQDALGDELCRVAESAGVDTRHVARARAPLATGTVRVKLTESGSPSYEIVEPAAWDEIEVSTAALSAVSQSRALVYGSLATRSPHNLEGLRRLLGVEGPLKLFDVNLRPPFSDPARVLELARSAHVLKLNEEELAELSAWVRGAPPPPTTREALGEACAALARACGVDRICVTRGAEGALFWDRGVLVGAAAPPSAVRDTVGAGDAFMAVLVYGLIHGTAIERLLDLGCRAGSYVASHEGATPALPAELVAAVRRG